MLLFVQVDQLDDGMIFFLASLPKESFDLVKNIYKKFVDVELKSQTVPRAKKGTTAKQLDLKGSQFKCLRGIEVSNVHRLLVEVSDCTISLREMGSECTALKLMQKVQSAFVRGTNSETWEMACDNFPKYTTSEYLEPFKKLDFSGKSLPSTFLNFCQRVLAENTQCAVAENESGSSAITQEQDNIFWVKSHDSIAVFWKTDIKMVIPETFMTMLKNALPANQSLNFSGFTLSIFDLTNGQNVS
jgi:hypothetical protein